ncbi:MAG: homocysteine S-methyltransferase family protein [Caldilineaceae bacterium]
MFAARRKGCWPATSAFCRLIETMSHLQRGGRRPSTARRIAPERYAIAATMSFDTNYHTMMGVSPRDAVRQLADWGIRFAGANCGNGPGEIEVVMTQMAQYRPEGVYLIAQSNAGLPHYEDGQIQYDGTPQVMADYALRMRSLGINYIGACCGSTPAHIAAMKAALDAHADDPIPSPSAPAESAAGIRRESRAERAAALRTASRGVMREDVKRELGD